MKKTCWYIRKLISSTRKRDDRTRDIIYMTKVKESDGMRRIFFFSLFFRIKSPSPVSIKFRLISSLHFPAKMCSVCVFAVRPRGKWRKYFEIKNSKLYEKYFVIHGEVIFIVLFYFPCFSWFFFCKSVL